MVSGWGPSSSWPRFDGAVFYLVLVAAMVWCAVACNTFRDTGEPTNDDVLDLATDADDSDTAACGCAPDEACCEGACVEDDDAHCGPTCVNCARLDFVQGVRCELGTCIIESCNADRDNCNDDPLDGCEADLNSAGEHCGACGVECLAPKACQDGDCT